MTTLSTFLPGTMISRGFDAIRNKRGQLLLNWQRAKAHREEIFRITHELDICSDRDLADLGLCRSEIPAVANGTYRRG